MNLSPLQLCDLFSCRVVTSHLSQLVVWPILFSDRVTSPSHWVTKYSLRELTISATNPLQRLCDLTDIRFSTMRDPLVSVEFNNHLCILFNEGRKDIFNGDCRGIFNGGILAPWFSFRSAPFSAYNSLPLLTWIPRSLLENLFRSLDSNYLFTRRIWNQFHLPHLSLKLLIQFHVLLVYLLLSCSVWAVG